MKAFAINKITDLNTEKVPLNAVNIPMPVISEDELLIKVICCGVCHTELDEIEGRVAPLNFPMVPGHEVIGKVEKCGSKVKHFKNGDRVGVAWIYSSCGKCEFCTSGFENLCPEFMGTGRDVLGGYAEYMKVTEAFAYKIPEDISAIEAAPLLCAGAIGYRSLRLTGLQNGKALGLTGFGASGHLILKTALYLMPDSKVIVFTRNKEEQSFARSLGAYWAGGFEETPPFQVHAIIDTTPAWKPIVKSLFHLKPGGRLVINAIRKESADQHELQKLQYDNHLWMEKEIKSVANITRKDVREFLDIAASVPLKSTVETYPFDKANEALWDLKHKNIRGGKVLVW